MHIPTAGDEDRMRVRANPPLLRRRAGSSDAAPAPSATSPSDAAIRNDTAGDGADSVAIVERTDAEDSLERVVQELSHDLRQPLTSLTMNLQSAVKLLNGSTPQIPAALDALADCLSIERDMVELLAHAKHRAATVSAHAPIPLNDLARDLLLSVRNFESNWRLCLGERLASPSPVVVGGVVRLRFALLSFLRRALMLAETEHTAPDGIVIETRSTKDRAELRFTGLPLSLPVSESLQSLHMLITSLVGHLHGHAHLTVDGERVTHVISVPLAPMSTLCLPGGSRGD